MFCTNCGNSLNPGTEACPNCGAYVVAQAPVQMPGINNYLIPSILVTLCCCMPLGIVAIVFAAQVSSKLAAGDVAGAQAASNNAKLFCWLAFGLGLILNAIGILVYIPQMAHH